MTILICTIEIKTFLVHYYNEQLLYATLLKFYELLMFRTIHCAMAMDTFYITISYAAEVYSVFIDNFCMHFSYLETSYAILYYTTSFMHN